MKVIIDEYCLETYSDAFFVTDDTTFIEARKLILKYKSGEQSIKTIVVATNPYSNWFNDIQNEVQILIEKILPTEILKNKFPTVDIDKDLEQKDILLLDLINDTIEPTEISIIHKHIGSFLLNNKNLIEELYEITNFASNPSKKFLDSKYLQKKWTKYLDKIGSNSKLVSSILNKVKEGDKDFCKVINKLVYMSNSKILLKDFMHDEMEYLVSSLKCTAIEIESFFTETRFKLTFSNQHEIKIERFFTTLFQEDIKEFFYEKGNYRATLKAFLAIAKSISKKEKEFIFSIYDNLIDHEIAEKIRFLIKPELHTPPKIDNLSLSMQIEAWQKWAINSFIPFKFYIDEYPSNDDINLVEEYANVYSDWLFNSYSDIIHNGFKTNYNITGIIHDELCESSIIWLIIDGLPVAYTETLNSVLKSHGINKINQSYNFAAIPTITEIGIPTQLSGKFPNSEGYTNNKAEALKLAFNSKKVIFKSSIKHFAEALESDFDLCCLHWHEIDEFMHKEDNDIDSRRIVEITRLLNIRVKQIANIIKSNSDKKIKLIVSTDHGSTKCLTKGQNIKNSSLLEACKDNPKERCVEIVGKLSKVNLDENEIYNLKKEMTLNVNDWVIAKGYRYFGRFDYGYRHGGLTPEETIVPLLICEIEKNEILPIKVVFSGLVDLSLGYTETIKLQIRNDNDAVVEIENIRISEDKNFNINITQKVQPLSVKIFDGNVKLPKNVIIINQKAQLNVLVDYFLFGEKHQITSIVEVPIKKSVNENLDNLFN
jgi:hypothetical protein